MIVTYLLLICYLKNITIIKTKKIMIKLRKKKLADGSFSLYLDIYFDGKRKCESLALRLTKDKDNNKEVLKLANNIRAKKELEYQSFQNGFVPAHYSKINFVEYFEKMANERDRKNCKVYKNTLNYVKSFTKNYIQVSQIDEKWIEDFQKYMLRFVSQNSVWVYMNTLKAGINKAYREKLIQINPLHYFNQHVKRIETKKEFLSIEEIEMLANSECSHPEVKRAFLFSCFTGLRISDILKLDWEDVKKDKLDFRQKKTKGYEYIPLSQTAQELLNSQHDNVHSIRQGKVFELPCETQINVILKKWIKELGIAKRITYHNSRHTFATMSLTQGMDLYTLSQLMGHCNPRVTQVYAKIVDQKKIDAVNMLPYIKIA